MVENSETVNDARKVSRDKDVLVGENVRARRTIMGLTQQDLADELGITFQQFQKYEKGKNRISAGALHTIACMLGTSTDFYFENKPGTFELKTMGLARDFNNCTDKNKDVVLTLARMLANDD